MRRACAYASINVANGRSEDVQAVLVEEVQVRHGGRAPLADPVEVLRVQVDSHHLLPAVLLGQQVPAAVADGYPAAEADPSAVPVEVAGGDEHGVVVRPGGQYPVPSVPPPSRAQTGRVGHQYDVRPLAGVDLGDAGDVGLPAQLDPELGVAQVDHGELAACGVDGLLPAAQVGLPVAAGYPAAGGDGLLDAGALAYVSEADVHAGFGAEVQDLGDRRALPGLRGHPGRVGGVPGQGRLREAYDVGALPAGRLDEPRHALEVALDVVDIRMHADHRQPDGFHGKGERGRPY